MLQFHISIIGGQLYLDPNRVNNIVENYVFNEIL